MIKLLTYAAGLGNTTAVQILLDADAEQFYDESPPSIAVKARDVEMVRTLVVAGADPNQKLEQFDDETPLTTAIDKDYTEIIGILTGTSS